MAGENHIVGAGERTSRVRTENQVSNVVRVFFLFGVYSRDEDEMVIALKSEHMEWICYV